jgi:hypothetical protein
MTAQEARKKGLINESGTRNSAVKKENASTANRIQIRKAGEGDNQPLFILDGKEISKEEMDKIDPATIEAVNVLKDKSATDKYGEKGKNGAVEINSKKDQQQISMFLFGSQPRAGKC